MTKIVLILVLLLTLYNGCPALDRLQVTSLMGRPSAFFKYMRVQMNTTWMPLVTLDKTSIFECAALCGRATHCMTSQYSATDAKCRLYANSGFYMDQLPTGDLIQTIDLETADWIPIFHLENNKAITDAELLWLDESMASPDFDVGNAIFKSPIIHQPFIWSQIKQLRVSMTSAGLEVMHVRFNASGSDRVTWFNQARILDSSYSDIATAGVRDFSIKGDTGGGIVLRRFYVSSIHPGCPNDVAWFGVYGPARYCDYGKNGPRPLAFAYCPGNTKCFPATGIQGPGVLPILIYGGGAP